jgi:tetratricopeptide (TPR) repeat protein
MLEGMKQLVLIAAFAGGLFAADADVTQAQTLLKAHKYSEAIALLDKAHAAKPKSVEVTKALAAANLEEADSYMADAALPPMRKYPAALRAYRRVLELDKTNKKAQDNVTQIEDVYKQMGRPVPK